MSRPPLLVVAGPTAAGKTEAALALARAFGGELVGADSVQVYRGFDIGSAKPTAEELGGVAHHLIDVVDPSEPIDAARYASLADAAIEAIAARGRTPIVVGGAGLWIRALLRGLVELPPPDPELRARLEAEAEAAGGAALHARLRAVDPRVASSVHPNDRIRIVRALEVYAQTGTPLGEHQAAHELGGPRYRTLFFALDRERERLHARIRARRDRMLARGWVEEVRRLLDRWGPDARGLGAVGYRQLVAHLLDGVALDETRTRIYRATRTYARRQRTWFRGDAGVDAWTTAEALGGGAHDRRIARFLAGAGPG